MKTSIVASLTAAFLLIVIPAYPAEADAAKSKSDAVTFDTHSGYFVSNQFENGAPASFVVLTNQAAFDQVFGVAMVMRDKSHRLPDGIFDTNWVVAAIHRGKAFVTYEVEGVAVGGRTLTVRYRAKSQPTASAEFACPLILSVAKGNFDAVEFIENGIAIKRMQPQSQPAATFEIKCQESGTLTATNEAGKIIMIIRGGRGIGRATIRPAAGNWPKEVILRVYLPGLELLTLSAGEVKMTASVSSQNGNSRMLHLWRNNQEGPLITKDSPYWMEILARNAEGGLIDGLPPKGGWFEMTVPGALHTGTNELRLAWVDFYR